jgi:rhomboid family GlyGly-CTERM serine protease
MGLEKSKSTTAISVPTSWIVPAALLGIALLFMLGGETAREWLRYDRVWISEGESWRLLSGHLAHLGWSHFALNGAGLGLVWYLVGARYSSRVWVAIVGVSIATIDLGFWFFNPELHWYVGLSGLLHSLLAAGIVARLHPFDAETAVLALLLVSKLAWEQFGGALPGSEVTSGGPVIVAAHLYGAIGGVLGAVLSRIRVRPPASI